MDTYGKIRDLDIETKFTANVAVNIIVVDFHIWHLKYSGCIKNKPPTKAATNKKAKSHAQTNNSFKKIKNKKRFKTNSNKLKSQKD